MRNSELLSRLWIGHDAGLICLGPWELPSKRSPNTTESQQLIDDDSKPHASLRLGSSRNCVSRLTRTASRSRKSPNG